MSLSKGFPVLIISLLFILLLNACQVGQTISGWFATDTPTPTMTFTPTATATSTFTPTVTITYTPTPTFTATATFTLVPTKTNTPVSGEFVCDGANSSYEGQVVYMINQERAKAGVGPVKSNGALASAARAHSKDMAQSNYFSHTGSDGSSPFDRIKAAGYSYHNAGEIIYAGEGKYNSPYSAVSRWMGSPPHHDIMLDADYTEVGVGYWCDSNSKHKGYFTADFGKP